jgi:hypothetical protein
LFADNDEPLYRQKDAFLQNMARKMKRGTYNPELGKKLWQYYADRAAKRYVEDMRMSTPWNKVFPKKVREEAAADWEQRERESLKAGEYPKYVCTKHEDCRANARIGAACFLGVKDSRDKLRRTHSQRRR